VHLGENEGDYEAPTHQIKNQQYLHFVFHLDCILSLEKILWKVQLLLVETILYKYIDFRSINGFF
jgi:hypothetical protein